jgi:serine/threonine-protein kinase HipA
MPTFLWKGITGLPGLEYLAFNIAISNTDDHLRNHGFLLSPKGWRLAPAYDVNPSVDKRGLAMNIDTEDNSLDFELARSVADYFQLTARETKEILEQIKRATVRWPAIAQEIGILRIEQELMAGAFNLDEL